MKMCTGRAKWKQRGYHITEIISPPVKKTTKESAVTAKFVHHQAKRGRPSKKVPALVL